jgi:hypothetical protein
VIHRRRHRRSGCHQDKAGNDLDRGQARLLICPR